MIPRRPPSTASTGERAALVGLLSRGPHRVDPELQLDELAGLANAAGATVVLRVVQDRARPDPSTFIGRGKAAALAAACEEQQIDLVILDNELSPAQSRNLEKVVKRRVIDRTELVLDIFARRARTREGQLQVELAQLRYRLPRLAGSSDALSRLGGGIGTRGPGETKLESDRRRIRERIGALKQDIADVGRRRERLRTRRGRTGVPTVALVGYTNAGKTTLFNLLTGSDALASDALFVTLDPVVRRVKLPDARQIVLADTVGFLDRLPHDLVAAFKSTLEEVVDADLLLHVMDAAVPDRERRSRAVRSVLAEIGAAGVPLVDVFNKCDRLDPGDVDRLRTASPDAAFLSATRGDGRQALIDLIASRLDMDVERVHLRLDTRRSDDRLLLADLYRHTTVVSHVVDGDRASIDADVPRRLVSRFARRQVPA